MPTLFDQCRPPSESSIRRARAHNLAVRMRRSRWAHLSLDEAVCRVMGKKRRSRRQYSHKYVRLVANANVYQARAWHPVVGSVNLGCYGSESAAWAAVKTWIRAGCDPCRGLPDGVLPKWVVRDGDVFIVKRRPGVPVVAGRYASPEAAHRAAIERFKASDQSVRVARVECPRS